MAASKNQLKINITSNLNSRNTKLILYCEHKLKFSFVYNFLTYVLTESAFSINGSLAISELIARTGLG